MVKHEHSKVKDQKLYLLQERHVEPVYLYPVAGNSSHLILELQKMGRAFESMLRYL